MRIMTTIAAGAVVGLAALFGSASLASRRTAAINPKVTEATSADTICKTVYTKSIRPPRDMIAAENRANADGHRGHHPGAVGPPHYAAQCAGARGCPGGQGMKTTYELRRRSLRADPAGGGEVWLAAAEDAGVIQLIAGHHRRGRRR